VRLGGFRPGFLYPEPREDEMAKGTVKKKAPAKKVAAKKTAAKGKAGRGKAVKRAGAGGG
jgi:hypothetical protein